MRIVDGRAKDQGLGGASKKRAPVSRVEDVRWGENTHIEGVLKGYFDSLETAPN